MATAEISRAAPDEPPPPARTLRGAKDAAATCHACALWRDATQTVFGVGQKRAQIMLVGEQPGDQEDRAGRPFVGPAGRVLDEALQDAGIDRDAVYVTNVVKHFKHEKRGKRRIHKKPWEQEITACRPWLDLEIRLVRPQAIVALGATAARSLFGKTFLVTKERGRVFESSLAPTAMATVHPSSILRAPTDEERHAARLAFSRDLRTLARALKIAS